MKSLRSGPARAASIAIHRGCVVVAPAARPRYKLADLLKQCKPRARLAKAEREWLDGPPAGKEVP